MEDGSLYMTELELSNRNRGCQLAKPGHINRFRGNNVLHSIIDHQAEPKTLPDGAVAEHQQTLQAALHS